VRREIRGEDFKQRAQSTQPVDGCFPYRARPPFGGLFGLSIDDELLQLARAREAEFESALDTLVLPQPDLLLRQMRAYLADQDDHGRIKRFAETSVQLGEDEDAKQIKCSAVGFVSGSTLDFSIKLKKWQTGWRVSQFKFDLHLHGRKVSMIRFHLNGKQSWNPLVVPRCHVHIDGGKRAHVPFPIMNPRLTLQFICEVIEPDIGT